MFKIQIRKLSFTHVSKRILRKFQCLTALCICIQVTIVTSSPRYRNSHNHDGIEYDAALVVCGVDGTVYTLNAWTGARIGRFVSGPALVSSSTLGNDEDQDYDEEDFQNEDQEFGFDDDFQDHDLHYDSTMDLSNHLDSYTFNQKNSKFEQSYHNGNQRQTKRREQIVPGLDFNLYSLTYEDEEDYSNNQGTKRHKSKKRKNAQLNILPVNVMDVTESPVSTCTNTKAHDDDDEMECGIIMGEKKSTVFALDVSTGQVIWMQRPSSSEMGFTSSLREGGGVTFSTSSHNKNQKSQRKRKNGTVLLQREDYFVRKIDTDSGEEWWNVTVAHFSALDFLSPFQQTTDEIVSTVTSSAQNNRYRRPSSTAATGKVKKTQWENNLSPGSAPNQFNRLSLAGQSSVERGNDSLHMKDIINFDGDHEHQRDSYFDKKSSVGRQSTKIEEMIEMRRDPFSSPDDIFLPFPSIAFGEDGTTITAVDSSAGKILWTENIDSIVAAVYGVGKENRWVSVEVVDESDILYEPEEEKKYFNNIQRLMSRFSEKVKDDSRFKALALSSVPNTNNIFNSPGYDSSIIPFLYKRNTNEVIPVMENSRQKELAWLAKHAATQFVKSTTHRTSSQMKAQQIDYNPLKVSYPSLDFSSPYSESIDAVSQKVYERKDGLFLSWRDVICIIFFIFGAAAGVRTRYLQQREKWMNTPVISSVTTGITNKSHSEHSEIPPLLLPRGSNSQPGPGSLARSVSLPQLKTSNGSGSRSHDSSTFKKFDRSLDHRQFRMSKLSIDEESDNARGLNTNQTTKEKSKQDSSSKIKNEANAKYSSIDGLPLVRYTRYDSEFKELSALGKGGFGTVFRCINALDSREYAIKKIKIKSYIDPSGEPSKHLSAKLKRVLREVKILALLDHANIVRYYTAWLEIEKDKESDDQFCHEDEIGTTTGLRDGGLLSSEASSGKSFTFSKSDSKSSFRTNFLSMCTPKHNIVNGMKNNPLYLQGFDEESKASESFGNNKNSELNMVRSTSADLGFNWERSTSGILRENVNFDKGNEGNEQSNNTDTSDTIKMATHLNESTNKSDLSDSSDSCDSESDSNSDSSYDESYSTTCLDQSLTFEQYDTNGNITSIPEHEKKIEEKKKKIVKIQKHILYIQMQLCSQKTLADFLASPIARKNGDVSASSSSFECTDSDDSRIDITFAIRIFSQIARGVKHVHSQGLIHRDLKPSNCFVDDTGVVKVGDFGLSRTAATSNEEDTVDPFTFKKESFLGEEQNNTAGIGTRSYASPEQMNGSDYDASTDVYSLGIILFELCYPMYTGMERYLVFKDIRKRIFPKQWHETVAQSHPSLHVLMNSMLSDVPSERPSADEVADSIEALLAEYTVQSLDSLTSQKREGSLLLRVEADDIEGILPKTVKIIKEASPQVEIVQYGLRGQRSKAIMEFAVSVPTIQQLKNGSNYEESVILNNDVIESIFTALRENSDIKLVRRVTEKHLGRGDSCEASHVK